MRLTTRTGAVGAAVLAAVLSAAGCGTETARSMSTGATRTDRECGDPPIWFQAADPRRAPDAQGDTPDHAVHALAAARGIQIEVTGTDAVQPGGQPEDELELTVVDDLGRGGTYELAEVQGVWVVSGGEGCGAPPPQSFDDRDEACPPPSDLPTPSAGETLSYTYMTEC